MGAARVWSAPFHFTRHTRFDDQAMWLDDLRPAFGEEEFFYEAELERLSRDSRVSSGQSHPLPGAEREDDGGGGTTFGRGMCLEGGTGSMVYRNDVIPPAPLTLQEQ